MRLSISQMRAIPLIALSAGVFILAATVEVPPDMNGPEIRVDIPALHAGTRASGLDPSSCVDVATMDCVIDDPPRGLAVAGQ